MESKVSAASPRRIIRTVDRNAALRAELEKGRRQSLDALLHDTGEKMKEMFQGKLLIFFVLYYRGKDFDLEFGIS